MSVAVRIILRYLLGYLVLKNLVPQEISDLIQNDPDLSIMIGGGLAVCVEWITYMARRWGWKT